MTDRPDIFLMFQFSINTGSDHHLTRGKPRIDTRLERINIVTQPKELYTGKLQHHRREFQVEIQNILVALV